MLAIDFYPGGDTVFFFFLSSKEKRDVRREESVATTTPFLSFVVVVCVCCLVGFLFVRCCRFFFFFLSLFVVCCLCLLSVFVVCYLCLLFCFVIVVVCVPCLCLLFVVGAVVVCVCCCCLCLLFVWFFVCLIFFCCLSPAPLSFVVCVRVVVVVVYCLFGFLFVCFCRLLYARGARFTKWRAVCHIKDSGTPTHLAIDQNAETLALYGVICQANGLVPCAHHRARGVNGWQTRYPSCCRSHGAGTGRRGVRHASPQVVS